MLKGSARVFPRLIWFIVIAAGALASARTAHADGPSATRSAFPDRRWDAVTAADAALAGSGLATDPGSSLYGNPALGLDGPEIFRLSGLRQGQDIDIVYTGIRPGGKLAEELRLDEESYEHTEHDKVRRLSNPSNP